MIRSRSTRNHQGRRATLRSAPFVVSALSLAGVVAGCQGTYWPFGGNGGGNPTPTPRPTATPTPNPSGGPTPTPTPIGNPTPTPSPSATPSPTPSPSPTPTPLPNGLTTLVNLGVTNSSDAYSEALSVNINGTVIGGTSGTLPGIGTPLATRYPRDAFRWSTSGGLQNLGVVLSGGYESGSIVGLSDDGSVAVGRSSASNFGVYQSFVRSASGALFTPSPFAGNYNSVQAHGSSADGQTVVGQLNGNSGERAFSWNGANQRVLDDLPGGLTSGQANAVSGDGSTIVGYGFASNLGEPVRWVNGVVSGMGVPSGFATGIAYGVNNDGSVIVGLVSTASNHYEAFRWQNGTYTVLGVNGDGTESTALGVSGDGTVVVGRLDSAGGSNAFVWTASGGLRTLKSVLASRGVDVSGWSRLESANAISRNGAAIVGRGVLPNGQVRAFRAYTQIGW